MSRFSLFGWLARMTSKRRAPAQGRRRSPPPRFVPRLLALEDRTLPSVFTVTNLNDSGLGSLRQAVLDANSQPGLDVIVFAPQARGTIGLTTGQLSVTDYLAVVGPGADQLAVSGNQQSRVFSISGGATVVMTDLTITNGRAVGIDGGGAILNAGSTLALAHVVMSNNQAEGAPGGIIARGGAIRNLSGASLTVTDSTFEGNQAIGGAGSGQGSGGAIFSGFSSATVSHSTFRGNEARGGTGGGQSNGGAISSQNSSLTVSHSKFLGNQSRAGLGTGIGPPPGRRPRPGRRHRHWYDCHHHRQHVPRQPGHRGGRRQRLRPRRRHLHQQRYRHRREQYVHRQPGPRRFQQHGQCRPSWLGRRRWRL